MYSGSFILGCGTFDPLSEDLHLGTEVKVYFSFSWPRPKVGSISLK